MARLLRHRQTKGPVTDRPNLNHRVTPRLYKSKVFFLATGDGDGLRYALLLGWGRSGTTWIGQLLNRYSGCQHKYEPFNSRKCEAYFTWLDDLIAGKDTDELRALFEELCCGCVCP